MSKLDIYELVIEVTRRCNMKCGHCMRGEPQAKDLDVKTLIPLLDKTETIGTIVFTGGEPSIVPGVLRDILNEIKKRNINVDRFYLVTNGKKVTQQFLRIIMDWFTFVNESEWFDAETPAMLALSKDKYHEDISEVNIKKLKMFSFFNEDEHNTDFNKIPVQNKGRARNLKYQKTCDRKLQPTDIEIEIDNQTGKIYITSLITVTVNGDILSDCDYEYANTAPITITSLNRKTWLDDICQRPKA